MKKNKKIYTDKKKRRRKNQGEKTKEKLTKKK